MRLCWVRLLLLLLLVPTGASAGWKRVSSVSRRLTRDPAPPHTIQSRDSAFAPRAPAGHPDRIDRVAEALFSHELEPLLAAKAVEIRKLSRTRIGLGRLGEPPADPFDAALVEALTSSASERVSVLKQSRTQGNLVGQNPPEEERRSARRQLSSGEIASALSQLVEQHTDDLGIVDYAALERRLGPSSQPLLSAMRRVAKLGTREPGWSEQKLGVYGDYSFVARVGMLRAREVEMGGFWKTVLRTRVNRPLADIELVGVQHLFASTAELLKGLVSAGLHPWDVHLFGKPYSTVRSIHEALQGDGFLHSVLVGAVRDPERVRWAVTQAIAGLPPGRRLLVIDDGGEMLKAINELPEHLARRVIGVEQTTRGITVLSELKLKFPVVNVARSVAKREHEAPLVGQAILRALEAKLERLGRKDRTKPLLVIGNGTVGRATIARLRAQGYTDIHVYDKSPEARAAAAGDGITVHDTLEAALPYGQVVLSVTGQKDIITPDNAELLPEGAILVNGASRATEFSEGLRGFIKRAFQKDVVMTNRFAGRSIRVGSSFDPSRRDAVLRLPSGKELLLASSGHVINFTGEATDPIPLRYIQLTSGLLYLGALQAASTHEPGLHDLAETPQHELVRDVEEDLARTGESLKDPSF